jgi:RNA polymerase sigma-70 factor (ECF subfamily)
MIKKNSRMTYQAETVSNYSVEPKAHQFETREIIDKCLAILPPVQKSIILLRDLEGYNYKEIGEILTLSESQVKVYLFRARKKLKKHLKDLTVLV